MDIEVIYVISIVLLFFPDPPTIPNAVYGIVVKCSNEIKTADNPVYGARIDASLQIP